MSIWDLVEYPLFRGVLYLDCPLLEVLLCYQGHTSCQMLKMVDQENALSYGAYTIKF